MPEPYALRYCDGCKLGFSPSGYNSHLLQTKDPLCAAIYNAQLQRAHVNSEDDMEDIDSEAKSDPRVKPASVVPFDEDLEQEDHPGFPADVIDVSSDGEIDIELHDEDVGWEPVRVGANQEADDDQVDENNPQEEDEDETHENDALRPDTRTTQLKPKIIRYSDKYPNQKAGAIRKQKTPLDYDYCEKVAEKDNPYAPFTSKTDWELGKWGKMRSAGSTVFDELLAIDGVSFKFPVRLCALLLIK
jgi:hypothetical protein